MVDANSLEIGQEIPPFVRKTGFAVWNRYAAVNDEFIPIHMDEEAGRAAGLPGAIGMGNLQVSYLYNLVREWMGESGRILSASCQFRSPNLKDQTVTARGRVTAVEPTAEGTRVTLDVWTEDDEGNRLTPGACTVLIDA
jgi:acyl dehydratase